VPALPTRSPMARARARLIRSPSPKGAGGGCIDPVTMLARVSALSTQNAPGRRTDERALRRARPRSRLASIQIIDALGFGDVGKCALQVAQAMEDNAAIDVGIR